MVLPVCAGAGESRTSDRHRRAARPAVVDASASITPAMRAWTVTLLRDELSCRWRSSLHVCERGGARIPFPQSKALGGGVGCAACQAFGDQLEGALYRLAADPVRMADRRLVTDGWPKSRRRAARDRRGAVGRIRLDIFTPPGARLIPGVLMTNLSHRRHSRRRAICARRDDGKSQRRAGPDSDHHLSRWRADCRSQSDAAAGSERSIRCAPKRRALLRGAAFAG